jgi:hypothetical protein
MPGPCANVALAHHCKPSAQYGADSHPESLSLPRVLPLSRQGKALSKAMQSIIRFLRVRSRLGFPQVATAEPWPWPWPRGALRPSLQRRPTLRRPKRPQVHAHFWAQQRIRVARLQSAEQGDAKYPPLSSTVADRSGRHRASIILSTLPCARDCVNRRMARSKHDVSVLQTCATNIYEYT